MSIKKRYFLSKAEHYVFDALLIILNGASVNRKLATKLVPPKDKSTSKQYVKCTELKALSFFV